MFNNVVKMNFFTVFEKMGFLLTNWKISRRDSISAWVPENEHVHIQKK